MRHAGRDRAAFQSIAVDESDADVTGVVMPFKDDSLEDIALDVDALVAATVLGGLDQHLVGEQLVLFQSDHTLEGLDLGDHQLIGCNGLHME